MSLRGVENPERPRKGRGRPKRDKRLKSFTERFKKHEDKKKI
jgi:hypothetical protein